MKKTLSYILGLAVGLLIVHPPIDYTIPVMVNSFAWVYAVIAAALLGCSLLGANIRTELKILSLYLFASCFFSQVPYLSFNAYILIVLSFYLYIAFKHCNFKTVVRFIEGAFWVELILVIMQFLGKDKLMNFDRPEYVFMGSVMQYMRLASVFAIMTPFLLTRSRWYIVPIIGLMIASRSMSFALSLAAGAMVYVFMVMKEKRALFIFCILGAVTLYGLYDIGSIRGAILPENGGRLVSWMAVLKTWVMDTSAARPPLPLAGPFNFQWLLVGHGIDTFLPLFPIYKHDMNPFPQAHNSWIQFLWEIGLIGTGLIIFYIAKLIKRLRESIRFDLIAGLAIIGTNMFFTFPVRMAQTVLLIVAYLAYCEKEIYYEEISSIIDNR